jgi:hypothetical protein
VASILPMVVIATVVMIAPDTGNNNIADVLGASVDSDSAVVVEIVGRWQQY